MSKTILQVPIDKALRDRALKRAKAAGFSSLQETIRVFLMNFTDGMTEVVFKEKSVTLTPKAARRYGAMMDDIEKGKVKVKNFTNTDDLMNDLLS